MKTTIKYVLLFVFFMLLNKGNSQGNTSSQILVIKDFKKSDFEKIEKEYKYSYSSIENLFGIVLLNSFPQIENKFQVQLQINSDSIEFVSVTHKGKYYTLTNNYRLTNFGNYVFIDYFFKEKIIFLRYEKKIDSKRIESLTSNKKEIEYIRFENNYGSCVKFENSSQQRMEGQYQILEEAKMDTTITFNQLTYEEQVTIRRNDLKKVGEWKYFDKEGKLIKKGKK